MALVALVGALGAQAGVPLVHIEAEVDDRLRTISGRIHIDSDRPFDLVDPLRGLPIPDDDLTLRRTFPGAAEVGSVRFEPIDDDEWWFYAILPRRYDDEGSIPGRGIFANGGWYPQMLISGRMPTVDWEVDVSLPPRATGAVGDQTGENLVQWRGLGERASLAVVPHGHVTRIAEDGLQLAVLTKGPPRNILLGELAEDLDEARPTTEAWNGVVVEAPLRRRLVRPGVGLAFVSDRAFRVTPGLRRFHRLAVTRGVVDSLLYVEDPFLRDVAAAGIARAYKARLTGMSARRILGLGAWLPGIDALLYDRRMPFVGEVLEETHPSDPLRDDLVERFDPHTPGSVVIALVEDRWGAAAVDALVDAILGGADLDGAAEDAKIPAEWLRGWQQPYPKQDYRLQVDHDADRFDVYRLAAETAPEEPLVIQVGDERTTWDAGPGSDQLELPLDGARRVVLDPDGHTAQLSRLGDAWPTRFVPVFSAWVATVNATDLWLDAEAWTAIRRSGDTHQVGTAALYTDRQTLLGLDIAWIYRFGHPIDGLHRAHRLVFDFGPALLDPRFAPTTGGRVALGGGVRWTWDSRVDDFFPARGGAISLSTDGGVVPGSAKRWVAVRSEATVLASPHPRHVFAFDAGAAWARGDVDHRLVPLGGDTGLRSLPAEAVIGTESVVARGEYRVAAIRNASVPLLGLAWLSEVQLAAGPEAGIAWRDGKPYRAAGATAGLSLVGDGFGLEPGLVGVTVGLPVWTDFDQPRQPEVWLRFAQAF
jgi:hypothetical protein